jgi:bacteriocin biosynthesis cyclodehydratase domain-containing protein
MEQPETSRTKPMSGSISSDTLGPTAMTWQPGVLFTVDAQGALHLLDLHGHHFRIKGATAAHVFICELLREPHTREDVIRQVIEHFPTVTAPEVAQMLSLLEERGLLVSHVDRIEAGIAQKELERFDRQIRYFGFFERNDMNRYHMHTALRQATVAVLGLGGVGTWVAWHLATMGVGRLLLIDRDEVELSNLNRQPLYDPGVVGQRKVDVAANRLTASNPQTTVCPIYRQIISPKDVVETADGADLVVLTADQPMILIRRWVSEACVRKGVPWVQGSLDAYSLQVGPFYSPPATGCYSCRELTTRAAEPEGYDAQIAELMRSPRLRPPLLGPLCGFVGSAVAMDTVRYLAGFEAPASFGRFFMIDARSWTTRVELVERHPACPACSHMPNPAVAPIERGYSPVSPPGHLERVRI